MSQKFSVALCIALIGVGLPRASAVQGSAQAKMRVIRALAVSKTSDLVFHDATPGSAPDTVAADTLETPQNASFNVSGEPNRAISVTLPPSGSVYMNNPSSPLGFDIPVNNFTSNAPTAIGPSGSTDIFVGATREALLPDQPPGNYEGTFTISIVYQ